MIVRRHQAHIEHRDAADSYGGMQTQKVSDAGGLTRFGASVQTLAPGATSSVRHWHEQEDELLYVLAGRVTVVENDGEHHLEPGDAACWPAGVANAHHVKNLSDAPCTYLVMGTRPRHDVCHYPDVGRTLFTEGETWRLVDGEGRVLRSGRVADAG